MCVIICTNLDARRSVELYVCGTLKLLISVNILKIALYVEHNIIDNVY